MKEDITKNECYCSQNFHQMNIPQGKRKATRPKTNQRQVNSNSTLAKMMKLETNQCYGPTIPNDCNDIDANYQLKENWYTEKRSMNLQFVGSSMRTYMIHIIPKVMFVPNLPLPDTH